MEILQILAPFLIALLAFAMGYGGAKVAIRENARRIEECDKDIRRLEDNFHLHKEEVIDRLGRMETKLDAILNRQFS